MDATQSIPILCFKFFGFFAFCLFFFLVPFIAISRLSPLTTGKIQNTRKIDTLFDVRLTYPGEVECRGKQLSPTQWCQWLTISAFFESVVTPKNVWIIENTTRAIVKVTLFETVRQKSFHLRNLSKNVCVIAETREATTQSKPFRDIHEHKKVWSSQLKVSVRFESSAPLKKNGFICWKQTEIGCLFNTLAKKHNS